MKEILFKAYIKKVIDSIDGLELDNSLLYLNSILENSEIKDILGGGKSLEIAYKYLNEKLKFINKYKYGFYVEEINNQDVIKGAKSLITAKCFITKGIKQGDFKEIIKGILISNYFELPFNQLIEIEDFSKEERRKLSEKIKEFLSALSIKINIPNDAPYNEKRYFEEYENGRLFIENFLKEAGKENCFLLCNEMFRKWERYLKNFIKQNKYIQEPLYTNSFYMIIYYFILRGNQQEDFLLELERNLFRILEINCIWCESSIEIRARFFVNLTYLYLLCIECRHKGYTLNSRKDLISELELFLNDKRIWLYYFRTLNKPLLLKEIEENFNLINK